ncbi:MAG: hypothetical protein WC389_22405 [Lutibacter sp.]|jgi:hypothetical protein
MKHKFTIEELKKMSDDEIIRILVNERRNDLSNPYTPFADRLKKIASELDNRIMKGNYRQ